MDVESLKKSCTILEIEPFNSKNRQSGVLISKNGDNTVDVHRRELQKLTNLRRSGTRGTVEDRAGISVKLITRDNKVTATIMATKCGIIEPDYQPGEVIDSEEFQKFSSEERMAKIENICVLARSDKLLMVQYLKQKGHVFTFIGRGIGDAQALREANVGLCFGTQGAEIVNACSVIVLSCKDFPFIIDILTWGRGIYDIVQIYTQFLLIASFVALLIDFVIAVSSSEPPGLNTESVDCFEICLLFSVFTFFSIELYVVNVEV
ncbi:calcium-transporting ATPase 13, plasma membrane-type [Olea europaea subsp. europaea]|uniref:Calcium-transporting ATPase 13, plasma membrane-type n=1 Tax=Olea europaea subsp. europaea TaxID=158383 RepID=A0A8S0VCG5_OLEEU|nr:calcium-transporting ATPase 13, plasma membrane-type [Olea europaea subsp. europaea]